MTYRTDHTNRMTSHTYRQDGGGELRLYADSGATMIGTWDFTSDEALRRAEARWIHRSITPDAEAARISAAFSDYLDSLEPANIPNF